MSINRRMDIFKVARWLHSVRSYIHIGQHLAEDEAIFFCAFQNTRSFPEISQQDSAWFFWPELGHMALFSSLIVKE